MKKKDHRNKITRKLNNHAHRNNKSVARKRPQHASIVKKKKCNIADAGRTKVHADTPRLSNKQIHHKESIVASDDKFSDIALQKCRNIEIIKWLDENYTVNEGVCMPRCILYGHYLEFCRAKNVIAACPATFGKIALHISDKKGWMEKEEKLHAKYTIRQKFPNLTTRRLGTRGKSKYHYYGIGIKESSPYYNGLLSFSGLTRFSGGRTTDQANYLTENTGTLLPPFPNMERLAFPSNIPTDKVETFFIMYKTHCQCVLNAVINANFDQIDTFLCHFWQGIPAHLVSLLKDRAVIDIVCYYDHTLYKVLNDIMIPKAMQAASGHVLSEIRTMVKRFESWVAIALKNLPEVLLKRKLIVATHFIHSLRRQTSFIFLMLEWQALRENSELETKIINTIKGIKALPHDSIDHLANQDIAMILEVTTTLKRLIMQKSPINVYIEWLDNLAQQQITKCGLMTRLDEYQTSACDFLTLWSKATHLMCAQLKGCDVTICDAIHTMKMMLDEYLCLAMESHYYRNLDGDMQENLNKYYAKEGYLSENPTTTSEDPFLDPSSDTGISGSDVDEDRSYLGYMYNNKHMDDYFSISSSPASVTHIKEEFMDTCDVSSASSSSNTSPPLFSSAIKKSNSVDMDLCYLQNHDNIIDLDSYLVTSTTNNRHSMEKDPNLACQNTTLKRTRIHRFDKHRRHSYPHCRISGNNHTSVDKISLISASMNRGKEFLSSSTQQQSLLDKNSTKQSAIDSSYSLSVPAATYQSVPYLDPVLSSGSVGDATSDSLMMSDDDISNEIEKSSIDTLLYPSNAEEEAIMNSGYDPYITYGQLQVNSNVMHNPEEVDLSSW